MKKIDFKKLGVLVCLIIVGLLAIFGVTKLVQKISGPSKKVVEEVENNVNKYFVYLSYGYSSIYNGLDVLYDKDKVTFEDLNKGAIIDAGIAYARDHEKDLNVPTTVIEDFKKSTKKTGIGYKGTVVGEAIKELFGKELALQTYMADANYLYDYYYDMDFDVIIKAKSATTDLSTTNNAVQTYIVSTKKEKGNIATTVAVAYVYNNGNSYSFAADKNGEKVVVSNKENNEFPKEKANEFTQYKFISKKVDGHYVFESMEKVK